MPGRQWDAALKSRQLRKTVTLAWLLAPEATPECEPPDHPWALPYPGPCVRDYLLTSRLNCLKMNLVTLPAIFLFKPSCEEGSEPQQADTLVWLLSSVLSPPRSSLSSPSALHTLCLRSNLPAWNGTPWLCLLWLCYSCARGF